MQQTKTREPIGFDQTDSDLVRSRLRLAFLVFMAIVFFGQTDVFAENITRSSTGVISNSDRPDVRQMGQIIELEFAIEESAEKKHPGTGRA